MKSENPDGSLDVAARRPVRARPLAVRALAACAVLGVFDTSEGIVRAQPPAETWDVTQPRGKTRVIDFTTDEGTIQSLGLSPDGRAVVFDLLEATAAIRRFLAGESGSDLFAGIPERVTLPPLAFELPVGPSLFDEWLASERKSDR